MQHTARLAEEIERLQFSAPLSAYHLALSVKQTIEGTLQLLINNSLLRPRCSPVVAEILMKLEHVNVLDRMSVQQACQKLYGDSKAAGDVCSAATFLLHASIACEAKAPAWAVALEQVN